MDISLPKGVIIKEIPETNGIYWAGNDGNIYSYSKAKININKPKPFRLSTCSFANKADYPHVTLFVDGKKKPHAVHRLICHAFNGEKPSPKHMVRHLDGTKHNNKPENLAWGTYAENSADARKHGVQAKGEKQGIAKLTDESVKIIRASIPFGLWNTKDAAQVFGVSQSTINQIARGRNWEHVK